MACEHYIILQDHDEHPTWQKVVPHNRKFWLVQTFIKMPPEAPEENFTVLKLSLQYMEFSHINCKLCMRMRMHRVCTNWAVKTFSFYSWSSWIIR